MPQAENHGPNIKEHVNSLGEKLKTLRLRLRRCVSSRPALSLAGGSLSSGVFRKHPPQTRFPPRDTKTQASRCPLPPARRRSRITCSFLSEQGVGWLLGIYM